MQILCSYTRYTERLLDVFIMMIAVILSELNENQRRKHWVREKYTKKFVWGASIFLVARVPSYVIFCRFFLSTLAFSYRLLQFYLAKKLGPKNGGGWVLACLQLLPVSTTVPAGSSGWYWYSLLSFFDTR